MKNEKNMSPGIYCIENTIDGKKYVGQSNNLNTRIGKHFSLLKNNKHFNVHLQRAYNKYGKSVFIYKILIYCEPFELSRYEQFFVDYYGTKFLYNICLECVDSKRGVEVSDETKRLMSLNRTNLYGKDNPNFGKDFTGENNPRTKLTWKDVNWIRKHKKEYTVEQLSEMFNVSSSTIKQIYLGQTWKDDAYIYTISSDKRSRKGENNYNAKLTMEEVLWIREHRKEYTLKELSEIFNVTKTNISRICLNILWKTEEDENK